MTQTRFTQLNHHDVTLDGHFCVVIISSEDVTYMVRCYYILGSIQYPSKYSGLTKWEHMTADNE